MVLKCRQCEFTDANLGTLIDHFKQKHSQKTKSDALKRQCSVVNLSMAKEIDLPPAKMARLEYTSLHYVLSNSIRFNIKSLFIDCIN